VPEENHSHAGVSLQIGASKSIPTGQLGRAWFVHTGQLSFEVVESAKSPRFHSITFASYSPGSFNADLTESFLERGSLLLGSAA
jgi:hypothetical protein